MAEAFMDKWAEICSILSEKISPNETEKSFAKDVLRVVEKLGWSEFKKEVQVEPILRVGSQGSIRPDMVIYADSRARIVVEVKRPGEDVKTTCIHPQLKSYMRQMKADFGWLVGKELQVFYEGDLNESGEPLLMDRITFNRNSEHGIAFVDIFRRESFLHGERVSSYVNEKIHKIREKQEIERLKQTLISKNTHDTIREFLASTFDSFGESVVEAAMKNLHIAVSYERNLVGTDSNPEVTLPPHLDPVTQTLAIDSVDTESIEVYRNKASGKCFIFIQHTGSGKAELIDFEGKIRSLKLNLFDPPEEKDKNDLLRRGLISGDQIEKYHKSTVQRQNQSTVAATGKVNIWTGKKQSPSATKWRMTIPELTNLDNLRTWQAICDYMDIPVEGDSARRRLKKWVKENRQNWVPVPDIL
jgi:hypothetical protein